jgi:ribosomal-protein-alanine N-acetyltransferase
MQRIVSDPEFMANWDSDGIDDPDVVDAIVQGQVDAMASGGAYYWAVTHASMGDFLGSCDLSEISWRRRHGEVGFILSRDTWGYGYGLEALHAVVAHAAALGLKRLWARTQVGAEPSEALLMKIGFKPDGYQRGHIQRAGERRDMRLFRLSL